MEDHTVAKSQEYQKVFVMSKKFGRKVVCKECNKRKPIGEVVKRKGITKYGLEYDVWICDDCWFDEERWEQPRLP